MLRYFGNDFYFLFFIFHFVFCCSILVGMFLIVLSMLIMNLWFVLVLCVGV